ncbi:hypothetical protein [Bacillus toyonensis]|uniref:hypothetical protein n=1 Tax=Bacillus toyonensis TaxID=155322 RepID=UPI000BFA6EC3|nr:hypothetical protein [Bacillus toyonensis]PGF04982.1 hypothetical protein COM61_00650 [Bacillus toyonensis]
MRQNDVMLIVKTPIGNFEVGSIKQDSKGNFKRPQIPYEQSKVKPTILTKPTEEMNAQIEGYVNLGFRRYLVLLQVTTVIYNENKDTQENFYLLDTKTCEVEENNVVYLDSFEGTLKDFHDIVQDIRMKLVLR